MGTPRTLYFVAIALFCILFTRKKRSFDCRSEATFSKIGLNVLQGEQFGPQNATTTGFGLKTNLSKFCVLASTGFPSSNGLRQYSHDTVLDSDCGEIALALLQCGQSTVINFISDFHHTSLSPTTDAYSYL